jgi:hypothetical protein
MRIVPLLVVLLLTLFPVPSVNAATSRWAPAANLTWQIQFSGSIDLSVSADVFDLDMVETSARTVRRLHDRGRRAVCYINAGAWENWRPDAGEYPQAVKGRPLDGWPGERWLDIRRLDVLGPILADRIELCRAKGFDGVEFDNVDGQGNRTGFDLSADDQVNFNRWLAQAAHDQGLAAGLKNALGLADRLEPDFDFAIVEQCFQYRECSLTAPFADAGKPVLDVEYSVARAQFCERAAQLGLFAMRKHLELDAWRRAC